MIRRACDADLPDLVGMMVAFRDQLGQPRPSAAEFRDAIAILRRKHEAEFFMARSEAGVALGYLQLRYRYSAWIPGLSAEIEDLFVVVEARRQGVGLALAEFATARARGRSCGVIGLNTNERNRAALSLYQRLGFSAERAAWRGSRQLWLEKRIEPAAAG
jgi:ribosomal protein S18 acetylase RimI-like enzyme